MRVSTGIIYETGTRLMLQQQEQLMETQQQLSTGKKIITPSDDPISAAQVLNIAQSASLNDQYSVNRRNANASLAQEENVLKKLTDIIQTVQSNVIYAGNASLTDENRKMIAAELRSHFGTLMSLANTTDEKGQFLFSGYQSNTKPFTQTGLSVEYAGDQGQRLNQVGPARQITISDSGSDIFERIKDGNGVFTTAAVSTNTGTGVIDVGSVITPTSLTGDSYQINFSVSSGITTYDVVNVTTGLPVSTSNPYVDNSTVSFDGMQLSIKGQPANGDTFTVTPSSNQGIFATMKDLITALETPASGQPGGTRLVNQLNTALQNLNNSSEHILTKQASIGAKLQELDALESVGSDQSIQYEQLLTQLQGVDYTQSITELQRQQVYLQAAQQAYIKVAGLSLFNYI
ncbi:MAG: flagellar hook-associated protein FlgL [Nitrosomonas sp.]|nr:MAG: flagellar hook-associated protein FlgL [Nitrosomonas sp.]